MTILFLKVTEKEIFNGILKQKNTDKNVLFFDRIIDDIEEHIDKNPLLVSKFMEIDKDKNCKNEEIEILLQDLKYKKIPSKLSPKNIHKFNVIIYLVLFLELATKLVTFLG